MAAVVIVSILMVGGIVLLKMALSHLKEQALTSGIAATIRSEVGAELKSIRAEMKDVSERLTHTNNRIPR